MKSFDELFDIADGESVLGMLDLAPTNCCDKESRRITRQHTPVAVKCVVKIKRR